MTRNNQILPELNVTTPHPNQTEHPQLYQVMHTHINSFTGNALLSMLLVVTATALPTVTGLTSYAIAAIIIFSAHIINNVWVVQFITNTDTEHDPDTLEWFLGNTLPSITFGLAAIAYLVITL